MQIVCPHCETHYDVRDEALKPAGRTVRCARCKETWLALPTAEPALAAADLHEPMKPADDSDAFAAMPDQPESPEPVHIDSPPLAAELPAMDPVRPDVVSTPAVDVIPEAIEPIGAPLRRKRAKAKFRPGLPAIIAALGAACAAIVIWRADVVRLMPQTAPFFKAIGLGVNLRALDFAAIRTSAETVNGITVLVIEGEVVARKPVEVPRLRFGLNDATGKEIHSWNATIEQASLAPGESAPFVSRLAAPAAEGREITVRFFNRRDIVSGGK